MERKRFRGKGKHQSSQLPSSLSSPAFAPPNIMTVFAWQRGSFVWKTHSKCRLSLTLGVEKCKLQHIKHPQTDTHRVQSASCNSREREAGRTIFLPLSNRVFFSSQSNTASVAWEREEEDVTHKERGGRWKCVCSSHSSRTVDTHRHWKQRLSHLPSDTGG